MHAGLQRHMTSHRQDGLPDPTVLQENRQERSSSSRSSWRCALDLPIQLLSRSGRLLHGRLRTYVSTARKPKYVPIVMCFFSCWRVYYLADLLCCVHGQSIPGHQLKRIVQVIEQRYSYKYALVHAHGYIQYSPGRFYVDTCKVRGAALE